jgi:protein TonB
VIQVAGDQMQVKDGVAYWSGRPVIVLTPATGDPRRDAQLAGVTFLVNGKAAPADFTPNSLDARDIGVIKVRQRADAEDGPTVIDIVMAPDAPPAPPAPPALVAPEAPPEPPTPPSPVSAPTPPTPPLAPLVRLQAPPPAPPAPPTPPAPPKPVVAQPVWDARPTGADVAAVYPRDALNAGLSGRVILMCKTTEAGLLAECSTRGETPAGNGFAEAALKLAPKFKIRPTTAEGLSVRTGQVNIPIVFNAPLAAPSPRPVPTTR